MKKSVKIICSDLHLGVGRILEDGRMNSLEEFYFDEKFVEFLHFYTNGKYSDYNVELILNGDILNLLQVDYRDHFLSVITEEVSLEKTKRIVTGHKRFFDALREFATKPGNSVTYIIGNHDQGVMWPAVKEYLNEVVGSEIRFRSLVYFFDGVHVEHGHMHEAANRINPKKFFVKRGFPEPILNLPFGSHFFIEFVMKIKEKHPHVDKIRPFSNMIRWAFLNETWFSIKCVISLGWYFVMSVLSKDPTKGWSVQKLLKIFLESAVFPDLSFAARKILKDPRVHIVVFGHSHVYQYRQWGGANEYFNTGTWTDLTSLDIASFGKITKLTYVLLEYPDDQKRPVGRLKEWKGYHRIEEDVAIS